MTPLVENLMEAQARNREQARLMRNPSPEVDSITECVREIARDATPRQRGHLATLLRLVKRLDESNAVELDLERLSAVIADTAAAAATPWSLRRAVRELRDPLAVLTNPMTVSQHKQARMDVLAVIAACPREILVTEGELSETLVHQLRQAKSRVLWALICEAAEASC